MKKIFVTALLSGLFILSFSCHADMDFHRKLGEIMQGPPTGHVHNLESGRSSYYDNDTWFKWLRKGSDAWKQGNWSGAIEATYGELDFANNVSVNQASCYISLAMLYHNVGNRQKSIESVEKAIYIMTTAPNLGCNCEERAVLFLNQLRSGINYTFTYRDTCQGGVLFYIMEIPTNVYDRSLQNWGAGF